MNHQCLHQSHQNPTKFPLRPIIVVPSRILRDKGTLDAAYASQILSKRGVAHEMQFTCEPWLDRKDSITEDELNEVKSFPDVKFVGFQSIIQDMYAKSDVVCLPSWYREGLQTAILESSAAGVPLVVCNNVGVRDFVRPNIDAIVAEPRNPESLADALEQMLSNEKAADEMRVNAHQRFLSGFTSKHMLAITSRALAELDSDIPVFEV